MTSDQSTLRHPIERVDAANTPHAASAVPAGDNNATTLSLVNRSQAVRVRVLDDTTVARWDAFVDGCSEATFCHRAGWRRVIEDSFGHSCHFLFAERDDVVCGVLPLVHLNTRFFGHALVSTGFCVYGGPVATDHEARAALDDTALQLARSLAVDRLEYRHLHQPETTRPCQSDLYVTFRKGIDPDPDRNLAAIPRKQRAMVRKGLKAGLVAEQDPDPNRFFTIYAESVRNHGTPVFAKRFFASLMCVFGDSCRVSTVIAGGRAVASVMTFYFRDEVMPYYGGGLDTARDVAAFDFMYWDVMRRASEDGYKMFDYGRSKRGTGSFSFKKHWGFEAQPLFYEFELFRGTTIPEINPLNPKYRLYIAAWKRLPVRVATLVGPHLARQLG